jgi:hypothetical protein
VLAPAAPSDKSHLTGLVTGPGGAPVVGAHVLIDSARVRQGTSALCPSCYLDCRKRAETGKDGAFRIESLDPELIFRILVVVEGFRPTFADNADPLTGPVNITLTPFDRSKLDSDRFLEGIVVDPDGRPLPGHESRPAGLSRRSSRGLAQTSLIRWLSPTFEASSS